MQRLAMRPVRGTLVADVKHNRNNRAVLLSLTVRHTLQVVDGRAKSPARKVLVVDDEPEILDMTSRAFVKAGGFEVRTANDPIAALEQIRKDSPDLIVLDIMLPQFSGLEFLRMLKYDRTTRHIPIVILTAKAEELDKLLGFEMGAIDYVTKPFSPRELVLRARAIIDLLSLPKSNLVLRFHNVRMDLSTHTVFVNDERVQLTAIEFKLLMRLMQAPTQVHARDHLLQDVWGYNRAMDTRTVDTHVRRLRGKLRSAAGLIETVRGFGYRIHPNALRDDNGVGPIGRAGNYFTD